MNETSMTALLQELVNYSKTLGGTPGAALTAERFLVAVLDKIAAPAEENTDRELQEVYSLMRPYELNMPRVRAALMEYVAKPNAIVDQLYMKKRMEDARLKCQEITAPCLLACILRQPSKALREAIEASNGTVAPQQIYVPGEIPGISEALMRIIRDKMGDDPSQEKAVEDGPEGKSASSPPEKTADSQLTAAKEQAKQKVSQLVDEVKSIRRVLSENIFGQDKAIDVFASGYFQSGMLATMDKSRRRPLATYLFAGPPGVGKTFLAENVAKALGLPFMRFDMSEYADKEAHLEFAGSDSVYRNGKEGNVTGFAAKHPRSVLLFDEIEKAHLVVIQLFLQILDAGRLRDNHTDKEVSFTDTILIFTTNAGKKLYEDSETGDLSNLSRKVIMKALQQDINPVTHEPFFPGAICSRFASGNVVMFNHIGAGNLRTIAKREIQRHARNLEANTGIRTLVDEQVYTALLFSEGSAVDARTIRSRSESFFNTELFELLRLVASDKVKTDIPQLEQIRVSVDLHSAGDEVRNLFIPNRAIKVMVFADDATVELCRSKLPDFQVVGVQTLADAVDVIKDSEVGLVLMDMRFGVQQDVLDTLNLEDVPSACRDFFKFLREQKSSQPVYLLEHRRSRLTQEERISFLRQGMRGSVTVAQGRDDFAKRMAEIFEALYQQESMIHLAQVNKLVTFETAQSISRNGKVATIRLFDFAMGVAVDAEDRKNILSSLSRPNVKFEDVIGAGDAKKELTYFVSYLRNPKKYLGTGVKPPKGIILYGPPGTGKTMLAKAMASEAGVTFLAAEGNQFLKKYVGEGQEEVHRLFRTARKYAPSVLFIDEIDAIAKPRTGNDDSASIEATLTAFLTEMDGFNTDPTKPVFVMAATNFDADRDGKSGLDGALMRRFDRRVYIGLPAKEDRIRFLEMKRQKNPALAISDSAIRNLAVRSTGMSLAALDSAMELALRSAIRQGSTVVTDDIMEEAFETFNSGEQKVFDASYLERTARHEAGHAVLCWLTGETPSYLTIVARGKHGGYMQYGDQEGKMGYTREELLDRIRISLGGRAAEMVCYGTENGLGTGASSDLATATSLARHILCSYGMDEEFGLAVVDEQAASFGPVAQQLRQAQNRILSRELEKAVALLRENRNKVDALVQALLEKDQLNAEEITQILSK